MTTRLKTVEYAMPALPNMTDNTLTAMTQITIHLPEAPSGTDFKSVIATVSAMGTATAAGNITTRRLDFSVGGATADTHTNSNLYTGSGEDIFAYHAADMTSHFVANWTSGTSQTFDASVLMDGTATSIAWTNVTVTLYITYEYDDTSPTQIKTVRIPLSMPTTALGTSKPGTALSTVPNLSTELPEGSKTYRSTYITIQGQHSSTSTTDPTLSMQLDATTAVTTSIFEGGQATNYFMRYIWDVSAVLNTSSTMGFYAWGSLANCWIHMQVWMTVTYEFDATAANDVYVSLLMPMEITSPMGGTTSSDYQRATREFWIEEPGTVATNSIAFYSFWDQAAAMAGQQQRIGTGSFVAYTTDTASVMAGSNAAMIQNDSAFTFARGRNQVNWDVYRTDTTDLGFNVSGFWIINYTAGKPAAGYGAASHTVFWNLSAYFDGVANVYRDIPSIAPALPETDRFYSAVGTRYLYVTNSTGNAAGVTVLVERLPAEGGTQWEAAYVDIGYTDPETGLRHAFSQVRTLFKRWPNDQDSTRMSLQTARRWRTVLNNNAKSFDYLDFIFTYHSIPITLSGTISRFSGTVTLYLHRADTGEIIDVTTRSGDGAYSFTWYDDTEDVFVAASDGTHFGRSASGKAGAVSFDFAAGGAQPVVRSFA
jgi:hypothetical protein